MLSKFVLDLPLKLSIPHTNAIKNILNIISTTKNKYI